MKQSLIIYVILLWTCLSDVTASYGQTAVNADADSLMAQGRRYFEQHNAEGALACFLPVSEMACQPSDFRHQTSDITTKVMRLRVRALNNIGCVYKYLLQDYIKAYDYFTRAYQLCEESGEKEFLSVVMVNLGDLMADYGMGYSSATLAKQSEDIFDKCIAHAFDSGNWELMTTAFFNLATQNYDLQLDKYRRIFSTEIPDTTRDLQYVRLLFEGLEHLQQHRYEDARRSFERQLPVVSARWQPERDTLATYMGIAHTYRMDGDYAGESEYLEKALALASRHGLSDQTGTIRHLATEAESHRLANQHRTQQLVIIFILLLLVVAGGFAVLLWRKNRQLNIRNQTLFDKNHQLLQAEASQLQLLKEMESAKYSGSSLTAERKDTLVYRIEELLNTPDVICQQDLTLAKLAKMADSNTTYVSQVVNERYGTTFSNVVASARIREACRRMDDEHDRYRQITIEAIATGVGFRSRTSFINAFKRDVGLTPSEYLRLAAAKEA